MIKVDVTYTAPTPPIEKVTLELSEGDGRLILALAGVASGAPSDISERLYHIYKPL